MRNDTAITEPEQQYASAYAAHYTERDLPTALRLYMKVMGSYPGTQEADNARAQIQNIVNSVVPKQEVLDAEIKLALDHFEHEGPPDAEPTAAGPLASQLST